MVKLKRWLAESVGGSVAAAEGFVWPVDRIPAEGRDALAEAERDTTQLFEELRTPALRYLLSMGLSAADGEEVVQEVFLALFRHLRQGRPRTNLRGWVFRTAHNLALKSRRRGLNVTGSAPEDLADERPNAEQLLTARRRLAKIQSVVRALPGRERCCLSLRAEGLSYREIAETLGISLGAVSIAVTRSVARMREADR
jgi:RNA polymerase sigma-70 factor (ECF subfamily)